jgi:hypothetical protein
VILWIEVLFSLMTSLMYSIFRSVCNDWLLTYQGAFVIIRSIFDWLLWIIDIFDLYYTMTASLVQSPSVYDSLDNFGS